MTNIMDYQVDNLFLLVGGNPLPNYVGAKTLLKAGGKPYFVYSTGTKPYAEALRDALSADNSSMVPLQDESDTFKIQGDIQDVLNTIPENTTVGLNYTGGKKVMSVHAYQAIKKLRSDAVFSYLDSLTSEMVIEQCMNQPLRLPMLTPENRVDISLKSLFELHGIKLAEEKPRTQPLMLEVVQKIVSHYAHGENKLWTDWLNDKNATIKDDTLLSSCPFSDVAAAFEGYGLKTIGDIIKAHDCFQKVVRPNTPLKAVTTWLRGGWLEDYVLYSLLLIKDELQLVKPLCSVQTAAQRDRHHFEVDVVVLRGYHLFLFSCKVPTSRATNKLALFEAKLRANQLGGDQARFALVTARDKNEIDPDDEEGWKKDENIERDMAGLIDKDIFHVFYRGDLLKLKDRIKQWIKQVDKDVRRK